MKIRNVFNKVLIEKNVKVLGVIKPIRAHEVCLFYYTNYFLILQVKKNINIIMNKTTSKKKFFTLKCSQKQKSFKCSKTFFIASLKLLLVFLQIRSYCFSIVVCINHSHEKQKRLSISSQSTHGVVSTSIRRPIDVETTLCNYWVVTVHKLKAILQVCLVS